MATRPHLSECSESWSTDEQASSLTWSRADRSFAQSWFRGDSNSRQPSFLKARRQPRYRGASSCRRDDRSWTPERYLARLRIDVDRPAIEAMKSNQQRNEKA